MATPPKEPVLGVGFWEAFSVIGALMCVSGPLVFAYRFFEWLKVGSWPNITVQDALVYYKFPPATAEWVGVEKILDWLQNLEIEYALIECGIILLMVGSHFEQIAHAEAAARRAPKVSNQEGQ